METFNRIEFKYLIENATYEKFLNELKNYVTLDEYNEDGLPYGISNVYYDSDEYYLARSAMIDPEYKFKVRMRMYDSSSDNVYLELKEKYDGTVNKTRILISFEQAQQILQGNYLMDVIPKPMMKIISGYRLKPQSFISYERLAFVANDNEDLRITFDFNILGRNYDIESPDKKLTNYIVLEIKTNNGLPQWLLILLAKYRINTENFSKYVRFYKKHKKEKKKIDEFNQTFK